MCVCLPSADSRPCRKPGLAARGTHQSIELQNQTIASSPSRSDFLSDSLSIGLADEPSVRLPMYVRGPGVPQGVISKLPTTHLDITATILELTGTTNGPATPTNLDGLSFASALQDTPAASKLRDMPELWREFSFSEFFMNDVTWWNVRTVNSTHKFSFHYWCQGVSEVFNLLEVSHS